MKPRKHSAVPTIRQVADHVGVSPATVSRVLNGYPHIRDELRQSVLDAIAELGYKPNRVAQRLRASRSRLIGIIVTDITNPFFNTIMAGIEQTFYSHGYSVLMSNTAGDMRKELGYLEMMKNEEVAGLVIAPTSEDVKHVVDTAEAGLPVVIIDRRIKGDKARHLDMVLADNTEGAFNAVTHLIRLGHRRIGMIGGPQHLTSGRERLEGYRQAMRSAGLTVSKKWIRLGDHRYDSGFELLHQLLECDPPVTAIFASNNMMTLGALNALHQRGKRIPEDIAIVGFDDMGWSPSLNPPLTAVSQPTAEIGTLAAELLLERISRPDLPVRLMTLKTELMIRESCGSHLPR
ncbi:MAG: LacI family DNA-binding transcriptional regulator [Chloroflexi bacterium]|nr:LacI family DNA-binding transcriptional regulator [Chloroflexota bacterium]